VRAALEGCAELHTVWKEQNTPSGQKKIDKHNYIVINHLGRMTDETLQSRLHIINQKDLKTKTDIGMTVLSQNRPDCLHCEVQVACSLMLYTHVTRAVCVSKMSIVLTLHHEYNFICTNNMSAAFPAPVFMKC
jgi:hypothetical protein